MVVTHLEIRVMKCQGIHEIAKTLKLLAFYLHTLSLKWDSIINNSMMTGALLIHVRMFSACYFFCSDNYFKLPNDCSKV